MMMFYSLMMPAQNVFQRKKYQSYHTFQFIFGTFYRRIRFSKSGHFSWVYYKQWLSLLMAGKCGGETKPIVLPEHRIGRHVELEHRHCDSLWRVTLDVASIFKIAECYFKCATQNPTTKLAAKLFYQSS